MAADVTQFKGCYISSSLPKALTVPSFSKYQPNHRNFNTKHWSENVLYLKPQSRTLKVEHDKSSAQSCLPVPGRQHLAVQTDLYLEELCDVVEEADAQCETDPLQDRPPSPLFVPAKSGPDAETQIWPGELFDFDEEVEPLLESLVGQTLEQAVLEIMAEEELALLMDMQKDYDARRSAELVELKRLEEQERRICEEKRKRLAEQEEAIKLEDEVSKKIAVCIFSQNFLSELVPQVYKKLDFQGYFETDEPETKEIEQNFWPWLIDEVDQEITSLESSCVLLDSLIEDTVEDIAKTTSLKLASPDIYPEKKAVEEEQTEVQEKTEEQEETEDGNEVLEGVDENSLDRVE